MKKTTKKIYMNEHRVEKIIDITDPDHSEVYIYDIVIGFSLTARKNKTNEAIHIQVWGTHEAHSGDERPALMEIYHMYPPNCPVDMISITICIDLDDLTPTRPPHINVDWKSEKTNDEYLKEFIKDHPDGLNHRPLNITRTTGKGGRPYKRIDCNKIVDDILSFLRDQNVFLGFP